MPGARLIWLMVALLGIAALPGCGELARATGRTFHQKCQWRAKDYFKDPQVIALCHAIEASNLAEIDRLVAAGADVNALGKDNMTPLLWAYPDNKLERFTRLLKHGANPNVAITSDLNTRGGFGRGDSVTHMACKTKFPGYFEAVFAHGGDPNFVRDVPVTGFTPIFSVITGGGPNKKEHVRALIEKGADLDQLNGMWHTPAMQAVSWGGQYNIALLLLESGADWRIYKPRSNARLIHTVAMDGDRRKEFWPPEQAADYEKLVKWLEDHGESIKQAREDVKRWQSWMITTSGYRQKMEAEIAERIKREGGEPAGAAKTNE